jgi:hypothetical protein
MIFLLAERREPGADPAWRPLRRDEVVALNQARVKLGLREILADEPPRLRKG